MAMMTSCRSAAMLALLLAVGIGSGTPLLEATQHQAAGVGVSVAPTRWYATPSPGDFANGWYREYEDSFGQQTAGGGRSRDWGLVGPCAGSWSRNCKDCGLRQGYGRIYGSNRFPGCAYRRKEHRHQDFPGTLMENSWSRRGGGALRLRGGMPRHGGGGGGALQEHRFLAQQKARGGRPHDWGSIEQPAGLSFMSRTCRVCGQMQFYGRMYGSNRYPGYAPLPREQQDCPGT